MLLECQKEFVFVMRIFCVSFQCINIQYYYNYHNYNGTELLLRCVYNVYGLVFQTFHANNFKALELNFHEPSVIRENFKIVHIKNLTPPSNPHGFSTVYKWILKGTGWTSLSQFFFDQIVCENSNNNYCIMSILVMSLIHHSFPCLSHIVGSRDQTPLSKYTIPAGRDKEWSTWWSK